MCGSRVGGGGGVGDEGKVEEKLIEMLLRESNSLFSKLNGDAGQNDFLATSFSFLAAEEMSSSRFQDTSVRIV